MPLNNTVVKFRQDFNSLDRTGNLYAVKTSFNKKQYKAIRKMMKQLSFLKREQDVIRFITDKFFTKYDLYEP